MDVMDSLFISLAAAGLCVLLIAVVMQCCKDNVAEDLPPPQNKFPLMPVYAHELEPGLVVLQNQDGSYFRILQEYDSTMQKARYARGSVVDMNGASCSNVTPLQRSTIQYIPQYTRPHYQTRPTAPPSSPPAENLIDIDLTEHPPPYSRH